MPGQLTVIFGCMFSGKTNALIQFVRSKNLKRDEILILKPSMDHRYGSENIVTHDGTKMACRLFEPGMEWIEFHSPFLKLIAIDEIQFFERTFVAQINSMLLKGVDVVVSGLDKDFKGRPFGLMPKLIDAAHFKYHQKAICSVCGSDAEFTYRKTVSNVVLLIGGEDHYEARCANCMIFPD